MKEKNALTRLFDYGLNQCSPVVDDFVRKVQYDEDGNEFIIYEKVDYPKLQESLGTVDMWSLNALLKAGINPDFPIHTGNPTRLEGFGMLQEFDAISEQILSEEDNKNKE